LTAKQRPLEVLVFPVARGITPRGNHREHPD